MLYVRTAGDPEAVAGTVRREVQSLDRNLLLQVESMGTSIRELLWAQRLSAGVLAVFGALALLLATIGIYGVISYSVRQRTREIGVRLALGATAGDVRRMILREGVRLVAFGVLSGGAVSLAAAAVSEACCSSRIRATCPRSSWSRRRWRWWVCSRVGSRRFAPRISIPPWRCAMNSGAYFQRVAEPLGVA